MTKYSKFNPIYRLQKWLDSVPGQTFMNYAYSWGASIVILGALFKLTHLPGANTMLFLGMGTEVLVFFIAGFDRPFDKTEEGKELPTHVNVVPAGTPELTETQEFSETPEYTGGSDYSEGSEYSEDSGSNEGTGASGTPVAHGGTIIIGGSGVSSGVTPTDGIPAVAPVDGGSTAVDTEAIAAVASSVTTMAGGTVVSPVPQVNPELEEATANYVEELKRLTEMLSKVSEQSERLTRDSEEMENLNRTLTGICKVYEMQLKGASKQIGTIDEINEQTCRMAEQIAELNKIYTRMIEAMTVNMPKINSNGN
jgi:hypothetical protein